MFENAYIKGILALLSGVFLIWIGIVKHKENKHQSAGHLEEGTRRWEKRYPFIFMFWGVIFILVGLACLLGGS